MGLYSRKRKLLLCLAITLTLILNIGLAIFLEKTDVKTKLKESICKGLNCDEEKGSNSLDADSNENLFEYFDEDNFYYEDSLSFDSSPDRGQHFYYENNKLSPKINDPQLRAIWNEFVLIAGKDFVDKYVAEIEFSNDSRSDEIAYVEHAFKNDEKWTLNINLAYITNEKDVINSLVYEYSHIFSLNSTQVEISSDEDSCLTLYFYEGCAKSESYVLDFNNRFWRKYNASPDDYNFGEYYDFHEDEFVSEYAATNSLEDFAETYTYYALRGEEDLENVQRAKVKFMSSNKVINKDINRVRSVVKTLIKN